MSVKQQHERAWKR